jgi:hypothetical protein
MTTNREQVLELYTTMFNRAADASGLNYWANEMDNNNWIIADIASSFAQQTEYQTAFPTSDNTTFITTIYNNLLERAPETEGLNYWVSELDTGKIAPEHATLAIINGAKSNPNAQLDAQLIANKTAVSSYFSETLKLNDAAQATSIMNGITAQADTVTQAKSALDTFVANSYNADALEVFEGHKYLLYKDAKSYDDALIAAQQVDTNAESSLVTIESQAENDFILDFLNSNNITTTAPDGGGAIYTWIGASDAQTEGNWLWADNTNLEYTNWGSKNGATEPDNFDSSVIGGIYTGQQDAAAIALTDWPVGVTGQWNDIDGVNSLAYLVEIA